MSFLDQLKSQASAMQVQQSAQEENLEANTRKTELACKTVALYLADLATQLNVIQPTGPAFTLDGRARWPEMKLVNMRVDARKKKLRDQDVYEHIAMSWDITPRQGGVEAGAVSVNFPPDLERVEKRLNWGGIKFERKDIRYPETNKLKEVRFEYELRARGYVTVTPRHEEAQLEFRLANVTGFEIHHVSKAVATLQTEALDELAKLLVSQPNRFL